MLAVSVIMPTPVSYRLQHAVQAKAECSKACLLQMTYDNNIIYKHLGTGRQTPQFHQHLPHNKHILLQTHFPVH